MAIHDSDDRGHGHESRSPAIDPRLLGFFKELYHRNGESLERLFPKFHGDSFADFSRHFEAMCSEVKKGAAHRSKGGDAVLQRSLSVGSPGVTSRGIGGDEEPLKIERFKVRTVDIDGAPPPSGGSGQSGPKTGGATSK